MSFCVLSTENDGNGFTHVDNQFIKDWLPSAPAVALKVYLYGLCIAGKSDDVNCVENMCKALGVTESDVIDSYIYWEEFGLVNLASQNPLKVEYIGAGSRNIAKKVSAGKYKGFNSKMQKVLSGRMITVNEYNEYYTFLENTFFEPDALVEVAKYCVDVKGNDIGYAYILKIARDWDKAGIKNAEKIKEKISTQNFYNDQLVEILSLVGVKRKVDIEDRHLYQKWTEKFGFDGDVIKEVARRQKKQGGIMRLDRTLTEFYNLRLFSLKEIDDYVLVKEQNKELAIQVNRALGLYYADVTSEVETYIAPWLALGFSAETILLVAKFCFRCRIQNLEGMDVKLNQLFARGCVTQSAIAEYVEDIQKTDSQIAKVLDELGLTRNVCANDRKNFKLWTSWGLPVDVILYGAQVCNGAFNPMAMLNKTLAEFKQKDAFDLLKAQKVVLDGQPLQNQSNTPKKRNEFLNSSDREYSAEELLAMFEDLKEN